VLKAVTSREPRNGRAWRNLGVAYQQAKDPDNAIAAFQRALEVEPEMIAPLYNIALTYAAKQDADHVFEWLGKAKVTRRIDMTRAEVAPELAPFRSDPGFAAILPKASDFSDPFVEPVKIIREWVGETGNGQLVGLLAALATSIATVCPILLLRLPRRILAARTPAAFTSIPPGREN
jgi:tetratricopeptide (TPR) repeat protein